MADKLVHKVNNASDAVADAEAMVWAIFHIVQGMRQDELSNALTACCNQALRRLQAGGTILEGIAQQERLKEDM